MPTNPVTALYLTEVDNSRTQHASRCTADCYTCTQARDIVRKLATALPDTDLQTIGEIALHTVTAVTAVLLETAQKGFGWHAAAGTATWAAAEAATTLYRSPTAPEHPGGAL